MVERAERRRVTSRQATDDIGTEGRDACNRFNEWASECVRSAATVFSIDSRGHVGRRGIFGEAQSKRPFAALRPTQDARATDHVATVRVATFAGIWKPASRKTSSHMIVLAHKHL